MNNKEFSILHDFEESQFLVTRDYDHEDNEFIICYKFWCAPINGHATLTMRWDETREDDFKAAFEKFKDKEVCRELMLNLLNSELRE